MHASHHETFIFRLCPSLQCRQHLAGPPGLARIPRSQNPPGHPIQSSPLPELSALPLSLQSGALSLVVAADLLLHHPSSLSLAALATLRRSKNNCCPDSEEERPLNALARVKSIQLLNNQQCPVSIWQTCLPTVPAQVTTTSSDPNIKLRPIFVSQ